MDDARTRQLTPARRQQSPRVRRYRGGGAWFAAVGAAFSSAQLLLVRPTMGLGWDETVYISQVGRHAPAAYFSAPRARGTSLLVAPVAWWSSSTPLLRVYLALLSGLGLFLALRVWRGVVPTRVVALGGALFASLWVTLFYGPQAIPNLWVALGALGGVGCFLRAWRHGTGRGPLLGLAVSAAWMALLRPTDAVWVSLPLLLAASALPRWRDGRLLLAIVGGLGAGAAEWVIEAYVSFGGPIRRLSAGSRVEGGLGWHDAVADQLRGLAGRTLCRPCAGALPDAAVTVWWFALPVFALLGLVLAARAGRAEVAVLPCACAVTSAVPYLFLVGYAAPRFLLPAYALLALPVAGALVHLVTVPRGSRLALAVAAVSVGLLGHLAVQVTVLERVVDRTTRGHRRWARIADELHRDGVRPPCVLTGHDAQAPAIPIAFYAGCASASTGGHNENTTAAALARIARRIPVAVLTTASRRPPSYARTWRTVQLDGPVHARISPSRRKPSAG